MKKCGKKAVKKAVKKAETKAEKKNFGIKNTEGVVTTETTLNELINKLILVVIWNFRTSLCSPITDATKDAFENYCNESVRKNNKNSKPLQQNIRKNGFNAAESCIKVIDAVDAVKAGEGFVEYVNLYYSFNKDMLAVCNAAYDIISKAKNEKEMEKSLAPLRGRYYVLVGGYTRMAILTDKKNNTDPDLKMSVGIYDLALLKSFMSESKVSFDGGRKEDWNKAIELGIIALIAHDNIGDKKSMTGYAEELAVYNLTKKVFHSNLHSCKKNTLYSVYNANKNYFVHCGYSIAKVRTSIIVNHAKRFLVDEETGNVKDGEKSAINSIFEAFATGNNANPFKFMSADLLMVYEPGEFDLVIKTICDVYANVQAACPNKVNGDKFGKFLKGLDGFKKGECYTIGRILPLLKDLEEALIEEFGDKTEIMANEILAAGNDIKKITQICLRYKNNAKKKREAKKK